MAVLWSSRQWLFCGQQLHACQEREPQQGRCGSAVLGPGLQQRLNQLSGISVGDCTPEAGIVLKRHPLVPAGISMHAYRVQALKHVRCAAMRNMSAVLCLTRHKNLIFALVSLEAWRWPSSVQTCRASQKFGRLHCT